MSDQRSEHTRELVELFASGRINAMPDKRTDLVTRIAALQRELANLETRPAEPEGSHPVIAFVVTFSGGQTYHYAARKAQGKWWVTGTTRHTARTWDALLDWIDENNTEGLAGSNLAVLVADRVLV